MSAEEGKQWECGWRRPFEAESGDVADVDGAGLLDDLRGELTGLTRIGDAVGPAVEVASRLPVKTSPPSIRTCRPARLR